jgi:hypothetical protein
LSLERLESARSYLAYKSRSLDRSVMESRLRVVGNSAQKLTVVLAITCINEGSAKDN